MKTLNPLERAYLRRLNDTLDAMLNHPIGDTAAYLKAAMAHYDAMAAAYVHCQLHGPIHGAVARLEAIDGRLVVMQGDVEIDGMEAVREQVATWREPCPN